MTGRERATKIEESEMENAKKDTETTTEKLQIKNIEYSRATRRER